MISITDSKIIFPESTALHFIQTWWHVIASSILFISFILKTVMTQTTTDFGKYKHFWHTEQRFCEMYTLTDHLAVNEVIVLYKWRVVFRQYIPEKHKISGIRIYKLSNFLGYAYDMSVYLKVSTERVFRLVHWHVQWESHCLNIVYICTKSSYSQYLNISYS